MTVSNNVLLLMYLNKDPKECIILCVCVFLNLLSYSRPYADPSNVRVEEVRNAFIRDAGSGLHRS